MKYNGLRLLKFHKERYNYAFETQVLATVLGNYALLGLISYITILFIHTYSYTWPLWLLITLGALALMEATLRVKNIKAIRALTLITSTLVFSPLGLYLSGSITTPSSVYILIFIINICILSNGWKRICYFLALSAITLSFMIIENHFPSILMFHSPPKAVNLRLWDTIYVGLAWVVFSQVRSVTNVLSNHRIMLTKSNQDLYHESILDGLTNVFNKKYLLQTLDLALLGLRRNNSSLGILFIDIDNFKSYNDHYGHQEGDNCLIEVAGLINESLLRDGDKAFRFGGEEFVIVLESIDLEGTIVVANKILDSLCKRNILHENSYTENFVTVSLGITIFTTFHENLSREDLLKYPDQAMYEAKKSGKNQYKIIDAPQCTTTY